MYKFYLKQVSREFLKEFLILKKSILLLTHAILFFNSVLFKVFIINKYFFILELVIHIKHISLWIFIM
jgi:hypothetical protein